MKKISYIFGTWFGTGYFPVAPGTAGSFVAIPFVWFFAVWGKIPLAIFILLTLFVGVIASYVISADSKLDDPQIVVIDEVHGQALSLFLIPASFFHLNSILSWMVVLFSFGAFRLFDIWKPFPASFFDEKVHNGWGMMLDDTMAGIYAMFSTYIFYMLLTKIFGG